MKHWRLTWLLVFLLWTGGTIPVFADDPPPGIDYHLDEHRLPSRDGEFPGNIPIRKAIPPGPDYSTGDPGNSANPNVKDPDPGGAKEPGNPGKGRNSGTPSAGADSADTPRRPDIPGVNPPGAGTPDSANGGSANPDSTFVRTESGNAPGTEAPNANPEDTQAAETRETDIHKPGAKEPGKKTPWYKSLWNHVKGGVKGGVAGAIGTAIVIGVVVAGAAILGVTIGAPLLVTAAVVGVVAGAVYGIMAGDHFSWIRGIGIGGLAALTVISIGELGVGAAIRGAFQLVRSAGFRGALRALGSRSLGFLRGAFGAMRSGLPNFFRGLAKNPISTLRAAFFNKGFGTALGVNFIGNYMGQLAAKGKIPRAGQTFKILGESIAGTLLFDKLLRIRVPTGKSALGTGKVGDFHGVKDLRDFRSRIPRNAARLPWKKIPGGAEKGVKYKWTAPNGDVYNVRAHSIDPGAPAGSNASKGWIYRVEVRYGGKGKIYYMDSSGNFHQANVMNPNSPMYNEQIANDTHIPFTGR
jgi:hypothetical protein